MNLRKMSSRQNFLLGRRRKRSLPIPKIYWRINRRNSHNRKLVCIHRLVSTILIKPSRLSKSSQSRCNLSLIRCCRTSGIIMRHHSTTNSNLGTSNKGTITHSITSNIIMVKALDIIMEIITKCHNSSKCSSCKNHLEIILTKG